MDERGLGQQLQKTRQAAGLTQQELCLKANLSFSTLTKIERGAIKAPSIFTIQAIADALGLSLDELMGTVAPNRGKRQLSKTKGGASFIYFDVNGCLVYFFERAFTKIEADTGVRSDLVENAFWRYNDEICRGTMSMSDFNAELAKALKLKSFNWADYYLEALEPVKEMHELLAWAAEHYRVGLLSNIMPGLLSTMRRSGLIPDLPYDAIVDSSEVGVIKPEPKIYEIAQERAGVSAKEILFIEDSRANLMAADKLGWKVLWFNASNPGSSTARAREVLEPAD